MLGIMIHDLMYICYICKHLVTKAMPTYYIDSKDHIKELKISQAHCGWHVPGFKTTLMIRFSKTVKTRRVNASLDPGFLTYVCINRINQVF